MSTPVSLALILPACLGLITGLMLGLTGAGGGALAAPLLMLVLHLGAAQAAPISLLSVTLGAGVGALWGLRQGIVRYRAALVMAAAGIVASPLGIALARVLPNTPLMLAFALLLLYQARRAWWPVTAAGLEQRPCTLNPGTGRFVWNRPCAYALLGAGGFAGLLSGLLGVGGGFILVPALRRNTPLPMQSIAATSMAVLALVSLGGVGQWLAHGELDWGVGLPFLLGGLAGMVVGKWLSPHLPERHLQRLFGLLCVIMALGLIVRVFWHHLGAWLPR